MKYLMDSREPITQDEITKAVNDADAWLAENDCYGQTGNLIARLTAIVAEAYGYEVASFGDES